MSFLDRLPRTWVACGARATPAFRTCGVAGFYGALIATMAGGLLADRSLLILAAVSLVCGLSFFVYTYARKWVTGHECLVLLEHVWFALACASGTLWLLEVPILAYLDPVAVGLCIFLAAGRLGCTLVGCCHGRPATFGIVYGQEHAREGFPSHLVGVRLLPVAAAEGIGLLAIGLSGILALPFAPPGRVFVWFLAAYSILRFGLEGQRADERPHILGLSQARWMAIVELVLAIRFASPAAWFEPWVWGALGATLLVVLVLMRITNLRLRLGSGRHLSALRALIVAESARVRDANDFVPTLRRTNRGVGVAISWIAEDPRTPLHVSLSLPDGRRDLRLLCELAARALPEVAAESARLTADTVLHVTVREVPTTQRTPQARSEWRQRFEVLYGTVLRRMQAPGPPAAGTREPAAARPWFLRVQGTRRDAG